MGIFCDLHYNRNMLKVWHFVLVIIQPLTEAPNQFTFCHCSVAIEATNCTMSHTKSTDQCCVLVHFLSISLVHVFSFVSSCVCARSCEHVDLGRIDVFCIHLSLFITFFETSIHFFFLVFDFLVVLFRFNFNFTERVVLISHSFGICGFDFSSTSLILIEKISEIVCMSKAMAVDLVYLNVEITGNTKWIVVLSICIHFPHEPLRIFVYVFFFSVPEKWNDAFQLN